MVYIEQLNVGYKVRIVDDWPKLHRENPEGIVSVEPEPDYEIDSAAFDALFL